MPFVLPLFLKNKYVLTVIITLVIVLVVWLYFKLRTPAEKFARYDVPDDTPGRKLTDEEAQRARTIADAIYTELDGLNFISRNVGPYQDLANASDAVVVAAYNYWGQTYFDKHGTLYEAIMDERGIPFFGGVSQTFYDLQALLNNRFEKLGITK